MSTAATAAAASAAVHPVHYPARAASPGQLVQFVLDQDILLACEDQARSQGLDFSAWLQQTGNDALRAYLGV